ncbi:MAG: 8-amino-7-oxononanoate synthase [Gammaproteobacteria bacterium]|nr:8-amino-7-oxononanoate synthase [Gammaproteobacteria bacterium]
MNLDQRLADELELRRRQHLCRKRRILQSPQGAEIVIEGRHCLSFCSNDYLGLANHPQVIKALQDGAARYGVGSGASHLITGHSAAHHALEEELAEFTGRPRALLFSTGYMANLGAIGALTAPRDTVYEDRLNHASLVDAAVLSRARLRRYPHGDMSTLRNQLVRADKLALIVSDGVFSMDGDLAPVSALAELARDYNARLMIDDAHGLGVLGKTGRGTLEHLAINPDDVPVLMGTLGKAFGVFGAFVAGSEELIETLIQQARSYIYTTALPPALAEAARASLKLVQSEGWRREHLFSLITRFRSGAAQLGLPLLPSATPIQPLIVGESERALALSEKLYARGIVITAIHPPTIPKGQARLRITLSAAHTEQHIDRLLETLADVVDA